MMKRMLAVMFGAMAIGGAMVSPAFADSDLPKWQPSVQTFSYTLKPGINAIDLTSGGLVFIEKDGTTLYAFATSAEQRAVLPDGTYQFRRAGISECDVQNGILSSCR